MKYMSVTVFCIVNSMDNFVDMFLQITRILKETKGIIFVSICSIFGLVISLEEENVLFRL